MLIKTIPKERAQVGQTKENADKKKKKKRLPYSDIQKCKLTHDVKSTKFRVILNNGLWKYNGETICTGKLHI